MKKALYIVDSKSTPMCCDPSLHNVFEEENKTSHCGQCPAELTGDEIATGTCDKCHFDRIAANDRMWPKDISPGENK